jgi:beta-lactamase class A
MVIRAFLLMLMGAQTAMAQEASATLRQRLVDRIQQVPGAVVGVVFRELGGPAAVEINADSVFHAASTMKVPVMIEYFRRLDAGQITSDQTMALDTIFKSIVDGSPYALNAGVDSDSSVFSRVGQQVPLRWLVERMIVRSSNLATNALIELLDAQRVQATTVSLGAANMKVLRGVEDGKAFQQGLNNRTTARDLAALLEAIEAGMAAAPASNREMIEILAKQEFNEEIPAGLPAGTKVAHKTGWITGVQHDAAIIYPPNRKPYVLVVLTRGIADRPVAKKLIADVSRLVWEAQAKEGSGFRLQGSG